MAVESLATFFTTVLSRLQPTQGDLMYACARQARRIQERTISGTDIMGRAFAPYSTKGPHYHRPRQGASIRVRREAALHHARFYGGVRKRGSTAVRYASYAEYKASMGVTVPDLGGMEGRVLGNMDISVDRNRYQIEFGESVGLMDFGAPATEGGIGVTGEQAAQIAMGHNMGVPSRNLPQRQFLGISDSDTALIAADIKMRIMERRNTQGAVHGATTAGR